MWTPYVKFKSYLPFGIASLDLYIPPKDDDPVFCPYGLDGLINVKTVLDLILTSLHPPTNADRCSWLSKALLIKGPNGLSAWSSNESMSQVMRKLDNLELANF